MAPPEPAIYRLRSSSPFWRSLTIPPSSSSALPNLCTLVQPNFRIQHSTDSRLCHPVPVGGGLMGKCCRELHYLAMSLALKGGLEATIKPSTNRGSTTHALQIRKSETLLVKSPSADPNCWRPRPACFPNFRPSFWSASLARQRLSIWRLYLGLQRVHLYFLEFQVSAVVLLIVL